ncbi:MAG: ATP-binding protein [Stellaceae bacterium]
MKGREPVANRLALSLTQAMSTATRRVGGLIRWAGVRFSPDLGFGGQDSGLAAVPEPDSVAERPQRGLVWTSRLLLVAAAAVPLLLLTIAAWQNFRLVQLEAKQRVTVETGQLHEHALSAIETYALILAWIDDRIRGLDWDRVEHDGELHRFLSNLETLPQIGAVLLVDGEGQIRASGSQFPATAADASNRDAFVAQRDRNAGIFVGRQHMDQLTRLSDFDISRRRSTPDESFDGVIIISANPSYFADFFSTISRDENFSALLLRDDGSVLVRYPPLPGPRVFSSETPLMQAIAAQPDRSLFWGRGGIDGIGRLFGYQRIGEYALYVVFGIPRQGILAQWRANLVDYLLFAVPASLGLLCMTLFAVRQLQQQRVATWRWRATARRLNREMHRRMRAETDLHQAQKMEALGQLTGGVAHDFNNLLTVLQGCLEILSGRQSEQTLQARVEMALATVERGERLTSQLLAFARRQPLTVARLDLNDVLHRMAELMSRTVGSKVRVETDFSPDLWPVDADATQLELAVINLAINSRDAMPEGGVLRVRTFKTTSPDGVSGEAGNFVGLEISDTGAGMPPEILARAFEPFFTSKGPGKGTGLGLSLVYGFARQSGGSASIRSEVGRGTAVTLLLPRAREAGTPDEPGVISLPSDASA